MPHDASICGWIAFAGRHGRGRARRPNRSEVVRDAVREFVSRQQRQRQETRDREVVAAHRDRLARQLEALVNEQDER